MRIVGVDEEARIIYAIGRPRRKGIAAQMVKRGWTLKYLRGEVVSSARVLGKRVSWGASVGTLGFMDYDGGETLAITAAHVVGNPRMGVYGEVDVFNGGRIRALVEKATKIKPYGGVRVFVDRVKHAMGKYEFGEGNRADAALIRIPRRLNPVASGIGVGMVVAGSVPDSLSIVIKVPHILEELGVEMDVVYREPEIGDRVVLVGARERRRGVVEARRAKMLVNYGWGEALFEDAIVVRGIEKPFSYPGDSGSAVLYGGVR